jgi:short-subunit dehydrogenase
MRYPDLTIRTVAITGCSTGIGRATARTLKSAGWRVLTTARKPDDLASLTAEGFEAFALDTADPASVTTAAAALLAAAGGVVPALVNNAGFGQVGAVEDLTRDALRHQFEVNVIGMQDLTNRLIPAMREAGAGRIVNVSSVLGRITLPFMGAYCASKYAMESLSDALRVELRPAGIAVSLVEPGPITTEFRRTAARNAAGTLDPATTRHGATYQAELARREARTGRPDPFALPPEAVAKKILHALTARRPHTRYKVTVPAYGGALLRRLAPDSLLDRLMARAAFPPA